MVPQIIELIMSHVMKRDAIPRWWVTEMPWYDESGQVTYDTPVNVWERDELAVFHKVESYFETTFS